MCVITHEIKDKNYSVTQPERYLPLPRRTPYQYQPTHKENQVFMDKVEYAKWIPQIQEKFKRGSKWTFASLSPIPECTPVPIYTVIDVTELHWSAPLDDMYVQPKCVFVTSERLKHMPIAYAPNQLRPLTEEELTLVNLRNQKPSEVVSDGREIKLVAGEWCLVSNSTGEILKKYP